MAQKTKGRMGLQQLEGHRSGECREGGMFQATEG